MQDRFVSCGRLRFQISIQGVLKSAVKVIASPLFGKATDRVESRKRMKGG